MATPSKRKIVATEAGDLTKERILIAAQRLFAEHGFEGVSMRDVGTAAEVPFTLTTYHFRTKLNLYKSIFHRHRDLLYTHRMDALAKIELTGNALADITDITKAIVEPLMTLRRVKGGSELSRLIGRELHDPVEIKGGIVEEYFDPIAKLAMKMLQQAVPHASSSEICWAFYFATGAISINHVDAGRLERLSGGQCKSSNTPELIAKLTKFMAAGLSGALVQERGKVSRKPSALSS